MLQSPGLTTAWAKVIPLTELADAETMAVDYARSVGVTGEGLEALKALRALSAGTHVIGLAGAIRDGQLVVEAPEAALAAGRQAMVPVGCQRPGPGIGTAGSKDELFALLGPHAEEARKLYDSKGHQTLDEVKQQVLAGQRWSSPRGIWRTRWRAPGSRPGGTASPMGPERSAAGLRAPDMASRSPTPS